MAATEVKELDRIDRATQISKRHAGYAAAAAFVPVPVLDLAAIVAVQLRLIKELSELYEVPFSSNIAKGSVTSLVSSILPAQVGITVASAVKAIPIVGQLLGIASAPAFAGAATYAVGRVFTMHFESGGTLLTFDAEKMRDFFKEEYETATKSRSSGSGSGSGTAKSTS